MHSSKRVKTLTLEALNLSWSSLNHQAKWSNLRNPICNTLLFTPPVRVTRGWKTWNFSTKVSPFYFIILANALHAMYISICTSTATYHLSSNIIKKTLLQYPQLVKFMLKMFNTNKMNKWKKLHCDSKSRNSCTISSASSIICTQILTIQCFLSIASK